MTKMNGSVCKWGPIKERGTERKRKERKMKKKRKPVICVTRRGASEAGKVLGDCPAAEKQG